MIMNFEQYENKVKLLKYPSEPIIRSLRPTQKETDEYFKALKKYEKEHIEYKEARKKYNEEDNRIYLKFQEDAMKDVGLNTHKNADKIFWYAWEKGHSCGYQEVYNELIDLANIIL